MAFYPRLAATATGLITKFGQVVSLVRGSLTINPVTGATTGTTQTIPTVGIFQRIPSDLIDGSRIVATDRLLLIDGKVTPQMSDRVTVQGKTYNIEEITEVNPAGMPLTYALRVRA
jgi:hypothetical protein